MRWRGPAGITGSKPKRARDSADEAEPVAETPPNALPDVEAGEPNNRQQSDPSAATDNQSTVEVENRAKTRGGTNRLAEKEADDSERGDRKNWRNYVEPASSNQAPASKGTKRVAEDEADDSGRADRPSASDHLDPTAPKSVQDDSMARDSSPARVADKRSL